MRYYLRMEWNGMEWNGIEYYNDISVIFIKAS